jgi:chromosome partitioning protein
LENGFLNKIPNHIRSLQMKIIAFSSFKGGTAKTSTCLHLGSALAKFYGAKVLLVDFDAQANLTFGLGFGIDCMPSIVDVLEGKIKAEGVILKTDDPNLFLLPANAYLDGIESRSPIVGDLYGHERLKKVLTSLAYDFILIDTPPSLGWLTQSALFASQYSLICAMPEPYSIMALNRLNEIHSQIQEHHGIEILGVLLSFFDERGATNQGYVEAIESAFMGKLFKTKVRRDIAVSRTALKGKSVFDTMKQSRAGDDYKMLASEVLERLSLSPIETLKIKDQDAKLTRTH